MAFAGDVYTNPVTGERCVVRVGEESSDRTCSVVDLYVRPGGRVAGAHVHPSFSERFEVVAGEVGLRVGDEQGVGGPGTVRDVAPGVPHDWWNAGSSEAHVIVTLRGEEAVLRRFDTLITTLFGLAHERRVNAQGLPDPLQAAVIGQEYADVIRFLKPPLWAQRALFGVLAPIGRRAGRRASYPHHRDLVVEPAGAQPTAPA
jgi:mannose-6-phosphate isomerase-like protein (cupin superfamily)